MTRPQREKKNPAVRAKDIASHLGGELLGKNIFVAEIKALGAPYEKESAQAAQAADTIGVKEDVV